MKDVRYTESSLYLVVALETKFLKIHFESVRNGRKSIFISFSLWSYLEYQLSFKIY